MENSKSIAIFSSFITPHLGGVERYTDNLAKQLVLLGYKPILVTANYQNEKEIETINEIVIN